MAINNVLILGGGIAGVAAALAITRNNKLRCEIFEIRPVPVTIGGAINLTPNALRYLESLGVLEKLLERSCEVPRIDIFSHRTGRKISEIDFDNVEKFKFRARRVLRFDLLIAMIKTLEESGVKVQYGMKAVAIVHRENAVQISFEDGSMAEGDVLLGCDGIHSFARTAVVEPDRKPDYSGIANAYGMVDGSKFPSKPPFEATALYSGRKGSLIVSYYDIDRTKIYVSVVMEMDAAPSREGWKVKGEDQSSLKADILTRFAGSPEPFITELIAATDEWFFYPVYRLPPKGRWTSDKVILLGDAAHAMPPQGESVGLTLEDVVLFSRLLDRQASKSTPQVFKEYEDLRRARIDAAVDGANFRWETVKDKGWLGGILMEWLTVLVLWFTREKRVKNFSFDVRDIELPK